MKKNLFLGLLLAIASIMTTGCSSCKSENKNQEETEVEALELVPENVICADREVMYFRTPESHTLKWMESTATLTSFLTDDSIANAEFMEVTNGFQTQWPSEDGKGIYTKVTLITTNTMFTDSLVMDGGFYLDNQPLNDKEIVVTFAQALDLALQANCPKPQTRICVLRCPVGPVRVEDAYYIFGDGENDIGMLKYAGIGVALGNAGDQVKMSADYVTADIDDDGVWKALRHFHVI